MKKGDARVIDATVTFAKKALGGEATGHDWWHTYRVWKNAVAIGQKEGADLFLVQLAALLHDIDDWKFQGGDEAKSKEAVTSWLASQGVDPSQVAVVNEIIQVVSFKGKKLNIRPGFVEARVVQDADRLDAIGAIGIARVFAFGGYRQREIHNPELAHQEYETKEAYLNTKSTSINHFYEKLLLLKDLMNTKTGKAMAENRHAFLEIFLDQFHREWELQV